LGYKNKNKCKKYFEVVNSQMLPLVTFDGGVFLTR